MVDPVLKQAYKADRFNAIWDMHKVQVRQHRNAQRFADEMATTNDPTTPTTGAPTIRADEDDMFAVDSCNTRNVAYNYPVVYPPQPRCNPALIVMTTLLAVAVVSVLLGGAWYISHPAVPPTPPAITAPVPAPLAGEDYSVKFFVP